MRILQVAHNFVTLNRRGVELYTYWLAKELSRTDEIWLFFGDPQLKRKQSPCMGKYENLHFTKVRSVSSFATYKSFHIETAFKECIEKFKPDIVHFQHLLGLSLDLVDIVHKKNIPIVFSLHDLWFLCPTTLLLDKNLSLCERGHSNLKCLGCFLNYRKAKLASITSSCEKSASFLKIWLGKIVPRIYPTIKETIVILYLRKKKVRELFPKVDLFISASRFLRDKFIEYGLPGERIIYLDYGIETEQLNGIKRTESDQLRFGFMGSMAPHKGLHILIEAFNCIQSASLAIYSPMNSAYYLHCKKLAKNRHISFKGVAFGKKKKDAFSNLDILIVPSIWFEGSPLVVRDAFAAKIPVIASNIGGLRELVQNEKTGLLFEVGNADELATMINYLIGNPTEVKRMSSQISSPKTIQENIYELRKLYKDLINPK